jgi:hypothetical protein
MFYARSRCDRERMPSGDSHRQRYAIEPLLNLREVAQILGISTRGVERIIARGDLHPVWVGGIRRFQPRDVRAVAEGSTRRGRPGSGGEA